MGFDLHGINPQAIGERPVRPETEDRDDPAWDQYFSDLSFYESINPGVYFRSNIWYWRPIVIFMKELGASDELVEKLSYNSGDEVSEDEIKPFVALFNDMLESGSLDHFIADYEYMLDNLPQETCHVCNGEGTLEQKPIFWDEAKPWLGAHQHECHVCKGTGKVENFMKNYPMDKDHLVNFFQFAKHSGGFNVY